MGHQGKTRANAPPQPQARWSVGPAGQLFSLIRLILCTLRGRLMRSSRRSPPCLRRFPSARREGGRVSRISTDEQNRATTPGSRRGAHGAAKAIKANLGVTAGETHPRVGRRVISVIGHGIGGKHIPIMARLAKGKTLE